jgi:hypothetical protein
VIAHIIATLRIVIGTIGLFLGYNELSGNDFNAALNTIIIYAVGIVGFLSFTGHLIFHKSDARRLGWESDKPYYQYEVGFAHLAFALLAFLTCFGNWDFDAKVLTVLGYTIYLLQIGILYIWRCFSEHKVFSRYFLRHAIFTIVYVGLMFNFLFRVMKTTS